MKYVHENAKHKKYWDAQHPNVHTNELFRYADLSEVWEQTPTQWTRERDENALNHVCIFSSQYFDGFTVRKRHLSVPYLYVNLALFTGSFSFKPFVSLK